MVLDVGYWTRVLRKILILIVSIVMVYLGFKLAIFYMPFLIAFIMSLILEPGIKSLMKKLKMKRKFGAIILLVIIVLTIGGIITFASGTLISESSSFLGNINEYAESAINKINDIKNNVKKWNVQDSIISVIESSSADIINSVTGIIKNTIKSGLNFITSVPKMALYFVITIISLYFLCTDKVYMIDQLEHHLPESWVRKIFIHTKDITKSMGKYLKAQSILVLISFITVLTGLLIIKLIGFNVKYPLLYALGIGFVDALPILGSGTVMIPWAIVSASIGDIKLAVSILILWGVVTIIRQLLEPKIVGKHIGIHPIFTLIAMYTGFKFSGVIGLFIGPIILIILKNIFSTVIDNGVIKSIFLREI